MAGNYGYFVLKTIDQRHFRDYVNANFNELIQVYFHLHFNSNFHELFLVYFHIYFQEY